MQERYYSAVDEAIKLVDRSRGAETRAELLYYA
jgi:hypothetical protein